jgi:hypothetical protein
MTEYRKRVSVIERVERSDEFDRWLGTNDELEYHKAKNGVIDKINACTPEEKKSMGIGQNQVVVDVVTMLLNLLVTKLKYSYRTYFKISNSNTDKEMYGTDNYKHISFKK